MDFKDKFDAIKIFIEESYPAYLETFNIELPFITDEHIDFDAFKHGFCLFIDFNTVTFTSNYEDDCVSIAKVSADIYLVFRNKPTNILNEKLMNASSALYRLFRNERINIAHGITVQDVNFFRYVEGNKNLVASKFSIEFDIGF